MAMNAQDDAALFVYGTLMDGEERARLLRREIPAAPASLGGFERRRSRHFYLIRKLDARVDGFLLRGLGDSDFAILDTYEEVPALYTRERIVVNGPRDTLVRCWIYLPAGWERSG